MEKIEFKEYVNKLSEYLNSESLNTTVMVLSNKTYVLNGLYPTCNIEYCRNNNIEIINTKHYGGTIVNFAGDICIGNYQKCFNNFGFDTINALLIYLKNKNINCFIDGNDLLVDGFKCASYMSTNINGTIYTAIHITMNINLDLIKNICTKEMIKVPKGLYDYGITTEELINLFD